MIDAADHKQNGVVDWDEFLATMKAVRRHNTLHSLRTAAAAAAASSAASSSSAAEDKPATTATAAAEGL